jgi:2-amino-4-hydroxy-6-hydroxymethyldihydropteridine diphosphokinase
MTSQVYIGLGSNLGDRQQHLRTALGLIARINSTTVKKVSSFHVTAPVGKIDQPDFLNAVALLYTTLTPHKLLSELLKIETKMGRIRTEKWGPRTIDLDILLFDDLRIDTPDLTIPHPRMHERKFVLDPLKEIATRLPVY